MTIHTFQAVYPQLDKVPHSNTFFDSVKWRYHEYAAEGWFASSDQEALYIYQIKHADGQKFTGLVGMARTQDYLNKTIKKHEKTIQENEMKQGDLLIARGAAIKPVLLTYPSVPALESLILDYTNTHKKFYVLELGQEKHRFWQIKEADTITRIQALFKEHVETAYIADGHHRSASFAQAFQKTQNPKMEQMLCAFFPDNQLKINAFHRVVHDLGGLSKSDFLEQLSHVARFSRTEASLFPRQKYEFTFYLNQDWYIGCWNDIQVAEPEGFIQLDVDILNEHVLKPILDIKNIRNDSRITYVEGTRTPEQVAKATPTEGVAFCLYPVGFEDLKAVADSDGILPPKSTFFEPRLKNGLLVYETK